MFKKIKDYFEYRKNVRNAKKQIAHLINTTIPIVNEVSEHSADIVKFIIKFVESTKSIDNEKLIEMVLSEVSHVLQTDNDRIIEILTYLANLSQDDIQKILVHSVVETMHSKE